MGNRNNDSGSSSPAATGVGSSANTDSPQHNASSAGRRSLRNTTPGGAATDGADTATQTPKPATGKSTPTSKVEGDASDSKTLASALGLKRVEPDLVWGDDHRPTR